MKKMLGNRVIKMTLMFAVMVGLTVPTIAYGASPEEWGNYDIRTKPNDRLTAELIDEQFAKNGKGGVLLNHGKVFMEAGEKNGINPGILVGFAVVESGWGTSSKAKKNNNLGGIKCRADFPCRGGFAVFESPAHSIQVQAELLSGRMYFGDGRYTLKSILERYAPPSDGNTLYGSGGYIAVIGGLMEGRLMQSIDGSVKMVGSGGSYSEGGEADGKPVKVGSWKAKNFFMESQSQYVRNTGLDTSENVLPGETSYGLQIFSEKAYNLMLKIGWIFSAFIIGYISITVALYVAIIRGITYKTDWFEKITRINGDTFGKGTLYRVIGRVVVAMSVVFLFITGWYINLMGLIYMKVNDVLSFII